MKIFFNLKKPFYLEIITDSQGVVTLVQGKGGVPGTHTLTLPVFAVQSWCSLASYRDPSHWIWGPPYIQEVLINEILNLITSAKVLFPNKFPFTGMGG